MYLNVNTSAKRKTSDESRAEALSSLDYAYKTQKDQREALRAAEDALLALEYERLVQQLTPPAIGKSEGRKLVTNARITQGEYTLSNAQDAYGAARKVWQRAISMAKQVITANPVYWEGGKEIDCEVCKGQYWDMYDMKCPHCNRGKIFIPAKNPRRTM